MSTVVHERSKNSILWKYVLLFGAKRRKGIIFYFYTILLADLKPISMVVLLYIGRVRFETILYLQAGCHSGVVTVVCICNDWKGGKFRDISGWNLLLESSLRKSGKLPRAASSRYFEAFCSSAGFCVFSNTLNKSAIFSLSEEIHDMLFDDMLPTLEGFVKF